MFPTLHEFMIILPECILMLTALGLIIYTAFTKPLNASVHATQGMVTAVVAFFLAGLVTLAMKNETGVVLHALLSSDPYVVYAKVFILIAGMVTLVMMMPHLERYGLARIELPILILFATIGMLIMVSSQDLMSLFLGLELQSLSIYIIAAFAKEDIRANEAAMKYFVLGALSSAILLYGFSLLYGYAGTTNFDALFDSLRLQVGAPVNFGLQFGAILVLCGLAFKVSAVPFHMWTPDVYDGVPMPITAFFSALPKLAAVLVMYRFVLGPLAPLASILAGPLTILALASCFFASVAGVYQVQIKRLMAYSSISHVGFILLGLIAHNGSGVQGALLYLVIYFFMTIALFTCLLCLKREGRSIQLISDLKGLNHEHPLMSSVIALLLFSMAGIPPLAGFFAKFYVILSLVEAGHFIIASLAIVTSVVAAFFYIRIVKIMYFDKSTAIEMQSPVFQHMRIPSARFILILSLAVLLAASLAPDVFLKKTYTSASHLLHQ